MQINLFLKKLAIFEYFKLDSINEDSLFTFVVTKVARIHQTLGKCFKNSARIMGKPVNELCNLSMTAPCFI